MFITFEGDEGAGKSTQAARLAVRLRTAGHATRLTREPGGTPLANAFRALLLTPDESLAALTTAGLCPPTSVTNASPETSAEAGWAASATLAQSQPTPHAEPMLPLTEALLLSAARAQHVARIHAWLAEGAIVISDRYADATLAYQGDGRGYDKATLLTLTKMATGGLRPDVTLLLDLPVADGRARKLRGHAAGGEWNRLDQEAAAFHERVRSGYLALAAAEPERWVILDALLPVDTLADRAWEAVAARLT